MSEETFDNLRAEALDALREALEYVRDEEHAASIDETDASGIISEVADGCVPVYTSERFDVLADQRVYSQDVRELAGATDDMVEMAGVAIYMALEEALYEGLDTIAAEVFGDE